MLYTINYLFKYDVNELYNLYRKYLFHAISYPKFYIVLCNSKPISSLAIQIVGYLMLSKWFKTKITQKGSKLEKNWKFSFHFWPARTAVVTAMATVRPSRSVSLGPYGSIWINTMFFLLSMFWVIKWTMQFSKKKTYLSNSMKHSGHLDSKKQKKKRPCQKGKWKFSHFWPPCCSASPV